LRTVDLRSADDPTVMGARLFPKRLEAAPVLGAEPGGGVRKVVAGVRFIIRPDGTLLTGAGILPGVLSRAVEMPDRLGGGFLFAAGTQLWRAPSWLGTLRRLSVGSVPIEEVSVGLDRVYLRFGRGTLAAIDPRDGTRLDVGPLPAAPWLASVSAQDAWHSTAIADLRGVLVTEDAGNTWHPALRPAPQERAGLSSLPTSETPRSESHELSGVRALALAVTDGWPLTDATALVARDGNLIRIRLADGSVVEDSPNAFPMNPARCHPFSLATDRDRGAFGFTCGEPHGPTRVYVWAAETSKLVEARRFAEPRQVNAFGNGALAVRGSCQDRGRAPDESATIWCAMSPSGQWSDRIARGPGARLVVLSDGQTAVLTPPVSGDLGTARITRTEGSREISRPVSFPALPSDVAHTLRFGVWMDGFEQRRPGWVGGWVDLAGTAMGIEISLNGETRLGEYIRDAGTPVVAGRWGFGWPRSHLGFETTDGGMTWSKAVRLPDPLPEAAEAAEHVCGPVGCLAAGWVRVGWGAEPAANEPASDPLPRPRSPSAAALRFACEPTALTQDSSSASRPSAEYDAPAKPVTRFPALWHHDAPAIPAGQVGLWANPSSDLDDLRAVPLARAYAWGPRDQEWDGASHWVLLWAWPWGPELQMRSSGPSPAEWPKLEAAQAAMRTLGAWQNGWTVLPGDDADHALLVVRAGSGASGTRVALLESGHPPAWVRAPADSFETVEAAARMEGRWYIATSQRSREPPATVLWTLDEPVARELARLPRLALEPRPRVHLALRSDGRAVGIAVEGQPDLARDGSIWIVGVDPDTGEVSDPSPLAALGAVDGALAICAGDEPGWVLDLSYPASVDIRIGENWAATLAGVTTRVRMSAGRACVEGVVGSTDREAAAPAQELANGSRAPSLMRTGSGSLGALGVVVYCAHRYFHLRCIPQ
jgi:hypothetical protein